MCFFVILTKVSITKKLFSHDATVTGRVVTILSTTDKLGYRSTVLKGMLIDAAQALDTRRVIQVSGRSKLNKTNDLAFKVTRCWTVGQISTVQQQHLFILNRFLRICMKTIESSFFVVVLDTIDQPLALLPTLAVTSVETIQSSQYS